MAWKSQGVTETLLLPESCGLSLFNSQDKGACSRHALGFQVPGSVALDPSRSLSVRASGSQLLCFLKKMIQLRLRFTKSEFLERGPGIILLKTIFPLSPGVLVLVELWECCACDLDDSWHQEPPMLVKEGDCLVYRGLGRVTQCSVPEKTGAFFRNNFLSFIFLISLP